MNWLAEIWKWGSSNLFLWFVMLWWFTFPVFLLSSYARWWLWRERRDHQLSWGRIFALSVTASWWGDWKRLAQRWAARGSEGRFALVVVTAHVLPVYALLIIFALGKEYLLVYAIAAALFIPLVVLSARFVLSFPGKSPKEPDAGSREAVLFWKAPLKELVGVAPRLGHGFVVAAVIAAVAIHPKWAFPVEITGGGLVPQLLNALFGVVVAVGAWVTPVSAFLISVPIWRAGLALAGLIAFLFAIPAAPQAVMAYSEWIGHREAAKFAMIVLLAAVVAAMLVTVIVRGLPLDLPYQYSPDQLLR